MKDKSQKLSPFLYATGGEGDSEIFTSKLRFGIRILILILILILMRILISIRVFSQIKHLLRVECASKHESATSSWGRGTWRYTIYYIRMFVRVWLWI